MEETIEGLFRTIPSTDEVLKRRAVRSLVRKTSRPLILKIVRKTLEAVREEIQQNPNPGTVSVSLTDLDNAIERRLSEMLACRLQPVINATGVIVHTNLGRSPLSKLVIDAFQQIAPRYCALEYDVEKGRRGDRNAVLEPLARELFGSDGILVVNNNAAALLLILNTVAEGREVIVSRGELIEIGGSFRLPDLMAKSGAILREVGTTNRTRRGDYEAAITEQTAALLKIHPSNYRIIGFTEEAILEDLVALGEERSLPIIMDMGSGNLMNLSPLGISHEPTIQECLEIGVTVLCSSGDKLLGGPQAGIILGQASWLCRLKANPLTRALRADKMTYLALETTMRSFLTGHAQEEIPTLKMLFATEEEIRGRALKLIEALDPSNLAIGVKEGFSQTGGGAAPEQGLQTPLVTIEHRERSATELEEILRQASPPVIARIQDDQVLLDLRTVDEDEDAPLAKILASIP